MMRLAILIIALLAPAAFAQTGMEKKLAAKPAAEQYKRSYDKFKDQTMLESPHCTVNRIDKPGKTLIGVGVKLAAISTSEKTEYWLHISKIGAREFSWRDVESVIVLADGARFDLKISDRDRDVNVSSSSILGSVNTSVSEDLFIEMNPTILNEILKSKVVEMQVANAEFAVHDASLTIFRNIVAAAKP